MVRYDVKLHAFVPYLGGISAVFLDFSKDGQWVAYVAYPQGTLWRSRIDGSEALQLTFPPVSVIYPRLTAGKSHSPVPYLANRAGSLSFPRKVANHLRRSPQCQARPARSIRTGRQMGTL